MKKEWFDLQRFADDGGAGDNGGADTGAGDTGADDGGEGAPGAAGGTILGTPPVSDPPAAGGQGDSGEDGKDDKGNQQGSNQAPDAYDFKGIIPDGMEYDEASAKAFGDIAKSCGLTQEQASKVAGYGVQYMQKGVDAAMAAVVQRQQQWGDQARTQLGNQFDATVSKAATGIDALSTKIPGIREALNETGAGNRIEMIQLMAAVGELVGEDNGHNGTTGGQEKSIYPNTDFSLYK